MNERNFEKEGVCFTGHRSQKLPWGFNEQDERCVRMKAALKAEIIRTLEEGYRTFFCGMALGFDMICAETVLELKEQYDGITLIGALPCWTQSKKWIEKEQRRYDALLHRLDGVRCIHEEYNGPECMLERNRYMVDNSSVLIALFNGRVGGTKFTVDYAYKKGLEVRIIEP